MIKEALQYLIGLGNTRIEVIGEEVFSTQQLHRVQEETPATINVRSLSGFVDYLKSGFDGKQKLLVQVVGPTEIVAFSSFNRDYNRNYMIKATALLPEFQYGRFYDTEELIIKLQSGFVPNDDRANVLKIVGNVKEEAVKTYGDDGISQTVTAKSGVATVEEIAVPNPVLLTPFRTFVEVEQPVSEFIFRMQNGPRAALFEADGGAWKLAAMQSIKEYLKKALQKDIEAGSIVIIA